MSETYDKIFRQVVIRANQLTVSDASTLATNYSTAAIGQTEMSDRAVEFPAAAINDAILQAGDRLVNVIGANKHSPYRSWFTDTTNDIANGNVIPLVSSSNKSRVGVIGAVKDSTGGQKLVAKEYNQVIALKVSSPAITLKQSPFWYYTDNVRIWHTRSNVTCDIVAWDKVDQITLMNTSPTRGACPFPQDLHEALITGALSTLFRGTFNNEQAIQWKNYFDQTLERIAGFSSEARLELRKVTD